MKVSQSEQLLRMKEVLARDRNTVLDLESSLSNQLFSLLSEFYVLEKNDMKLEIHQDSKGVFLRLTAACQGAKKTFQLPKSN